MPGWCSGPSGSQDCIVVGCPRVESGPGQYSCADRRGFHGLSADKARLAHHGRSNAFLDADPPRLAGGANQAARSEEDELRPKLAQALERLWGRPPCGGFPQGSILGGRQARLPAERGRQPGAKTWGMVSRMAARVVANPTAWAARVG